MRKLVLLIAIVSSLWIKLWSFPTSLYWTPCITDVVPCGKVAITLSDYFSIFNGRGRRQTLPTDVGATFGIFQCGKWAAEAGFDYFAATDHPWFFNAKIRLDENAFGCSPSFAVGIYEVGTSRRTDFNVWDVVIGKTLFDKSRIFFGAYYGHHIGKNPGGLMFGYMKGFCQLEDCEGEKYYRWFLLADYATGKNLQGAGGVGLQYFVNPDCSILFGPTWFNDARLLGRWKWTVQAILVIPLKPSSSSAKIKKEQDKKKEEAKKKKEEEDKKKEEEKRKKAEEKRKKEDEKKKGEKAPKTSEKKEPKKKTATS